MSATARVKAAYQRIIAVDRPEIWITLRPVHEALQEAAEIDAAPERPLSGLLLAVKDNIDVAGLPTTAGCPDYAYEPARDATSVARLRAAGALVIGKTNLDQFATGLVGTRSPYGAVRDALRPKFVAGGSSSGSAVAVALGLVDIALGTDTAGSGRVPAAFQGLVGIKPTRGLVPVSGIVPASRTLDCVSVFAREILAAERALWLMAGPDRSATGASAALDRPWPPDAPLAACPAPRIGIPAGGHLSALSLEARRRFAEASERLTALGAQVHEIDLAPFLAAADLLYGGAFVAERHAAVGAFVGRHPDAVDPSVREIITAAASPTASQLVADGETLDELRVAARAVMNTVDALMLPTTPGQPTVAEVEDEPISTNARLGRYTNFTNLLDMCAVAVPAGHADGGHFGVSFMAPAFADRLLADVAASFLGEPASAHPECVPFGIELLVMGAHRRGQPLNAQLTDVGARHLGLAQTSADYRMYALRTDPPKPGLVRVHAHGASIEGELWRVPEGRLGSFLAALPQPMMLGAVTLQDGRQVVGFLCEPAAIGGAPDISDSGSWIRYLAGKGGSERAGQL